MRKIANRLRLSFVGDREILSLQTLHRLLALHHFDIHTHVGHAGAKDGILRGSRKTR